MPETLPFRLSERCFREYEGYIAQAVCVLPSTYQVLPRVGRSPSTVEARLRDSIRSLMQFRWTTSVNMVKFESLYNDMVVRRDGDTVEIALRGNKSPAASRVAAMLEVLPAQINQRVVDALCELVASGVIPQVCFKNTKNTDITLPWRFKDIVAAERDGNVYLM